MNHSAMVGILVHYSCSEDPLTKFTAITWLGEFVLLAKVRKKDGQSMLFRCCIVAIELKKKCFLWGQSAMLPFTADIITALLPSLSSADDKLRLVCFCLFVYYFWFCINHSLLCIRVWSVQRIGASGQRKPGQACDRH